MKLRILEPGDPRALSVVHRAVLFLVALLLAFQFSTIFAPIVGEHHWRQSDTYSVARNFHRVSADFFHPRIDWNHGRTGIMAMEAPIYPYLTHLLMYALGEDPATARFVSWSLFFLGALAALGMMRRLGGNSLMAGLLLALMLSPLVLFEARQVQPDGPALGLLLVAAAFFHRYSAAGKAWRFAIGMAAFAAAALIRPPVILVGPAMWLLSFSARPASYGAIVARGLWFAIPLGLWFGWSSWAEHLDAAFDQARGYFAIKVNWDEVRADLTNWDHLKNVFGFLVPGYAMNWTLLPAIAAGAVLSFRKEHRRVSLAFWAWLLAGVAVCFMFARRFYGHWYYSTQLVPPLAYFAALSWLHLWRLARPEAAPSPAAKGLFFFLVLVFAAVPVFGGPWESGARVVGASGPAANLTWATARGVWVALGAAAIAALLAWIVRGWRHWVAVTLAVVATLALVARGGHDLLQTFVHRARFHEWQTFERDWGGMRRAIDCYVPEDEVFLTDGGHPWYLYLAERRGFSEDPAVIDGRGPDFYRKHAVRVLLHFRERGGPPRRVVGDQQPLASGEKWDLFCIDPQGCQPGPGCLLAHLTPAPRSAILQERSGG
jgi:4-amino-4-deoxy-L-arabinose transferase-like glycosyltransferase